MVRIVVLEDIFVVLRLRGGYIVEYIIFNEFSISKVYISYKMRREIGVMFQRMDRRKTCR